MSEPSEHGIDPQAVEGCLDEAKRQAERFVQELNEQLGPTDSPVTLPAPSYPFEWKASALGFGYVEILSISPLDFGRQPALRFHGKGGGLAGGGGIYFGRGFTTEPPHALPGVRAAWSCAAIGGGVNGIRLGWVRDNRVLGMYVGVGPLLFNGVAGGEGPFSIWD